MADPQVAGQALIGRKIEVWWTKERRYYMGTVDDVCMENGAVVHHVFYPEDDDQQWHRLLGDRVVK